MPYNWQLASWPHFQYQQDKFAPLLAQYAATQGKLMGLLEGLPASYETQALIDVMVREALKTSAIEGELLSRPDVLSSIRNNLGLNRIPDNIRDRRAAGVAKLMVVVREDFHKPLSISMLFDWHQMLMESYANLTPGQWRRGTAPIQVISGSIGREVVHFEAPPSDRVPREMERFIEWYNTPPSPSESPLLISPIRSAIAHLYFESIHPFEDGNGRIGRAISEKVLSQGLGQPILISLSSVIEKRRRDYYQALQKAQRQDEVTEWIGYFLGVITESQADTERNFQFTLRKIQFFDRFKEQLNPRQSKALQRMFEAGPSGFTGGMSARKYASLTRSSKATATRDLRELVKMGALIIEGKGRNTRYTLPV
ncbi:MAG: Fic family protein [Bacteroidota bacterium]